MIWHDMICYGTVWYGMGCNDVVWYGMTSILVEAFIFEKGIKFENLQNYQHASASLCHSK